MVKEDEKLIIEDGVTVLEPLTFVDCQAKEIIITMARKTAANLNMHCVGLHI